MNIIFTILYDKITQISFVSQWTLKPFPFCWCHSTVCFVCLLFFFFCFFFFSNKKCHFSWMVHWPSNSIISLSLVKKTFHVSVKLSRDFCAYFLWATEIITQCLRKSLTHQRKWLSKVMSSSHAHTCYSLIMCQDWNVTIKIVFGLTVTIKWVLCSCTNQHLIDCWCFLCWQVAVLKIISHLFWTSQF